MATTIDLAAQSTAGFSTSTVWVVMSRPMAARSVVKTPSFVDATNIMGDDLLGISVTTGVKAGDTPAVMASRLQVQAKYFFNGG
jgi:hypothetical protein